MEKNQKTDNAVDLFIKGLQLRQFQDEKQKAQYALQLLEDILSNTDSVTARGYLNSLGLLRSVLQLKLPFETTPMNMVLKAIKIIKDEYIALKNVNEDKTENALRNFFTNKPIIPSPADFWNVEVDGVQLKSIILEAILEQKAEIEQCREVIATQGPNKIHNDEVILTGGFCPDVLSFLLRAAKTRKFQVMVAEGGPSFQGLRMAKCLSLANIQTTVIQDSAVFALMSRVNKIFLGCQTVLCNGAIRSFVGATNIASAASYNNVPVYVCAPTFTFSIERSVTVEDFDSPSAIIPSGLSDSNLKNVNISCSKYDCVPPQLITSFITNNHGIAPFYIDRHVRDIYHPNADSI